jgi:hypothetical protein
MSRTTRVTHSLVRHLRRKKFRRRGDPRSMKSCDWCPMLPSELSYPLRIPPSPRTQYSPLNHVRINASNACFEVARTATGGLQPAWRPDLWDGDGQVPRPRAFPPCVPVLLPGHITISTPGRFAYVTGIDIDFSRDPVLFAVVFYDDVEFWRYSVCALGQFIWQRWWQSTGHFPVQTVELVGTPPSGLHVPS